MNKLLFKSSNLQVSKSSPQNRNKTTWNIQREDLPENIVLAFDLCIVAQALTFIITISSILTSSNLLESADTGNGHWDNYVFISLTQSLSSHSLPIDDNLYIKKRNVDSMYFNCIYSFLYFESMVMYHTLPVYGGRFPLVIVAKGLPKRPANIVPIHQGCLIKYFQIATSKWMYRL
jgi:hypothetical protein